MIGILGHKGVLGTILKLELERMGKHYSCYEQDIRNKSALKIWLSSNRFTAIFHFAAKVPIDYVEKHKLESYSTNVGGCLMLAESIAELGIKPWLFYASTSHVYKPSKRKISESYPIQPINFYAQTKLEGEKIFQILSDESDINVCTGRIFSYYHELQKPPYLYPTIKNRLQNEDLTQPFSLMGANNVRDISNAEDVIKKILKLHDLKFSGKVNIGSGKGIKIADFVRKIAKQKIEIITDVGVNPNTLVADTKYFDTLTM